MAGDTSIDMMINVLPGTLTGIFALNAGLSSINQQFQNMTKAVDNHFGIVDAAIVSATALATQFGLKAADAFGQYEQGMKIVQAVSNQSAASIAELGQKASEFSVQYRMDIDELTTGLQTLGRAGLKSAQEQAEVLENGLQTAKLEGRDLNSVLEELIQNTALLGGDLKSADFGEQTKYVNDLSVATSMTAPITTHDVSETLKYSGGIAAAAGANIETEEGKKLLEDYMASIAAFAQKGVKGSIAGTALRAFFNKPATQDSSVLEGLKMIGLKPEYLWEDDQQTMKPVSEQISLIQSQMDKKGISQMDRLQIWSKIVGGKMGQQMMKLDGGEIKELTKDIQEANSAENLATQSMQTYQSAMKQTGEAGQQAFRAFGEHVARFLTPIAKTLTPILQAMANPVISTSVFIGFITLIGNAWKSVSKIFSALRLEIGMIKNLMSSMTLNQGTRRSIINNTPWSVTQNRNTNSLLMDSEKLKKTFSETSTQVNEMSTKLSSSIDNVIIKIYKVVDNTRDRITAIGNTIKENVEEINAKINISLSEIGSKLTGSFGKINTQITSSSSKLGSEFSTALSTSANVFGEKLNLAVSSSLMKLKTGGVGGNFVFSANTKGQPSKSQFLASKSGYLVSNAGIAKSMMNSQGQFNPYYQKIVASYNRQAQLLEEELAEIQSEKNIISTIVFTTRKVAKEKEEISKLENILIGKQKQLDNFYTANVANQKKISDETYLEYKYRQHQIKLLQEEIAIRTRQVEMMERHMVALETAYMEEIAAVKTSTAVATQTNTTLGFSRVGIYGASSQSTNVTPQTNTMPGTKISFSPNTTSGKGGYDYTKNQTHWSQEDINERKRILAERKELRRQIQKEQGAIQRDIAAKEEQVRLDKVYNETLAMAIVSMEESVFGKQAGMYYRYNDPAWRGFSRYNTPVLDEQDKKSLSESKRMNFVGYAYPGGASTAIGVHEAQEAAAAEREAAKARQQVYNSYSRYNLPNVDEEMKQLEEQQKANKFRSGSYPAGAAMLYQQMEENNKKQQEYIKRGEENIIKRQGRVAQARLKVSNFLGLSGASNISKAAKGFGSSLLKATNLVGGPFFAAIMAVDVAMQIWNHYQQEYSKKLQEATQKLDDMIQKQSEAEEIFYGGKHEKGEREIQGWDDENPDADYETREQALLDAYGSIYDNRSKGLSALDENTQQLAIATQEVRLATEKIGQTYLDERDFFSGIGDWSDFWHESAKGANAVQDAAAIDTDPTGFWKTANDKETSDNKNYVVDKHGNIMSAMSGAKNYFQGQDVVLDTSWQTGEDYPWLKEFSPIISADIWREGNTKSGLEIALGGAGFEKLQDQLSSVGGWDNSAWTKHGYNIMNSFGTETEQNKLQMGLKNYQKDFSKLAKQMRRFEKSTGKTPLKALNQQLGQTKNLKKALKNLSVQDPKLVSYIKSLAIKTGMDAQQVLMAAQLQQLQEMQSIARDQVTPRMESLVQGSYEYLGYGRNIMGEVDGSGDGAVSAAQNARAIAILLNAQMEDELNKRNFEDYQSHYEDPSKLKYQTPEQLAAAEQWAHNHPTEQNKWLRDLYDTKMGTYASVNAQLYNPQISLADAAKKGQEFVDAYNNSDVSAAGILDTLRKGGIGGLSKNILDAYDAGLDEQDSGGSGGSGSGKGSDKNKDNTGTKKERVDLVLCNKKEIPKLNVNLFKKAPSFTILNKNFKLRDIKVNTQDKPKAVLSSIKNAIIDVQKRTDPKIIQDEEAIYDPVGATDGNTPSGTSDVRTNTG